MVIFPLDLPSPFSLFSPPLPSTVLTSPLPFPSSLLFSAILFSPLLPLEIQEEADVPQSSTIFLAFSRIFSGTLSKGQELYVLQPRYDPRGAILEEWSEGPLPPHTARFTVEGLYLLMGRSVVPMDSVPAGNIVGIAGLKDIIVKSATVSSTLACPPFCAMSAVAAPIVRVAIEPVHFTDLSALLSGMKLLNQADPSVEVYVQESGEHVLAAAGEVHLQKCLDDLEKQYACVKLNVSEPIIPFRETVVVPPKVDMVNEEISADNELKVNTAQVHPDNTHPSRLVDSLQSCSYFTGCK